MEKMTYKDLSMKESLILRFFEIAATKTYRILGGGNGGVYTKKGVLHAAWLYRKYLVSLPADFPFLEDCYINAENGKSYTVPQIQDYFLHALMKTSLRKVVMGSIADGGLFYQGLNYTLGALDWSVGITSLFRKETWHWKNDLTLTRVMPGDAEGKEQLFVHVEFLDKPNQKPVILRRIGPFTPKHSMLNPSSLWISVISKWQECVRVLPTIASVTDSILNPSGISRGVRIVLISCLQQTSLI